MASVSAGPFGTPPRLDHHLGSPYVVGVGVVVVVVVVDKREEHQQLLKKSTKMDEDVYAELAASVRKLKKPLGELTRVHEQFVLDNLSGINSVKTVREVRRATEAIEREAAAEREVASREAIEREATGREATGREVAGEGR